MKVAYGLIELENKNVSDNANETSLSTVSSKKIEPDTLKATIFQSETIERIVTLFLIETY